MFDRITSVFLSPLAGTIIVILIGTPFYWLYRFDWIAISTIIVVFCTILIIAIARRLPIQRLRFLSIPALLSKIRLSLAKNKSAWLFSVLYLCAATVGFSLLFHGQTIDSSLGPWENLNTLFFVTYSIATFLLLCTTYFRKTITSVHTILLVVHGFFTLSILGIIFPLGYGFDPYLHRAAEQIISQFGIITPKTLYYIGQYVVVVFGHKLFAIPIFYLDIWLVPILASLSIVPLTIHATRVWIGDKPMIAFLSTLICIVPFSAIINTTPWSLSFLLFVVSFLLILTYAKQQSKLLLIFAWLTTIASIFVHPLGGIPAFIVLSITTLIFEILPRIKSVVFKKNVTGVTVAIASILAPLAFFLNGLVSKQLKVSVTTPDQLGGFITEIAGTLFSYTSRYKAWQDIAYSIAHIWGLLVILTAIGTTLYCWRSFKEYRQAMVTLWLSWLAIFINFILVKGFIAFTSVISYEQDIFATRLYDASMIVLLPLVSIAVYGLLRRMYTTPHAYSVIKLVGIIAFAGLITANLYVSYPKRDAYNAYHGYMVSSVNIATVKWIEADAGSADHIVLASQVMAASAIQEFGFKKYFQHEVGSVMQDVFYYPVPTSSPLYQNYRNMLSGPSREKAIAIMDEYGIQKLYVVVNHYEPQYEGTNNKLRAVATSEKIIHVSKSEDTVFVFER
ncbi:MAG: hypothetical protein Q8P11_04295 [bacterium]|nr:hypothetical protein [bacterium]